MAVADVGDVEGSVNVDGTEAAIDGCLLKGAGTNEIKTARFVGSVR